MPKELNGVVVTRVDPDSAAAEVGLREGDVIVEVNRVGTPDVDAFHKAVRQSERGVLLLVYRDGSTVFLSLSR